MKITIEFKSNGIHDYAILTVGKKNKYDTNYNLELRKIQDFINQYNEEQIERA